MSGQTVRALEKVFPGHPFSLKVSYLSHPGRVRTENEDGLGLPPLRAPSDEILRAKGCLFLVADGVGGQSSGEVASRMAIQATMSAYYDARDSQPFRDALASAFRFAHQQVRDAWRRPEQKGMGTTLVGLVVYKASAVIANVGDSRAYLWRQGRLAQITLDHSLVAEQVRLGTITPDLAKNHPMRHVITQSIGGQAEVQPDLFELTLQGDERILLCTDGLTDVVDDASVARILSNHSSTAAVEKLVKAALSAGGPDNITVAIVETVAPSGAVARKSVLDHPLAFPLFLGLGLLIVFAILYLVAKAVLPVPIPVQDPLPSPLPMCSQVEGGGGPGSAKYGFYIQGKVLDISVDDTGLWTILVKNSSSDYSLKVEKNAIFDPSFHPSKQDILKAVAVREDSGYRGLEVDVQRRGIFSSEWGTWVWDKEGLIERPYVYASLVDRRWLADERPIGERGFIPPLLLHGEWEEPRRSGRPEERLAVFRVDAIYIWIREAAISCYAKKWPIGR